MVTKSRTSWTRHLTHLKEDIFGFKSSWHHMTDNGRLMLK